MKKLIAFTFFAIVSALVARAEMPVRIAEANGPANVAAVGLSVNQSGKAGIAVYGRRVTCKLACVYALQQVDFTGSPLSPAYTITSGAAVSLFSFGADWSARDKWSGHIYGLGDLGLSQSYTPGAPLTIGTLTEFVRGGGALATVHPAKLPFSVGARLRYLVNAGPEYTAVVLFGRGQ